MTYKNKGERVAGAGADAQPVDPLKKQATATSEGSIKSTNRFMAFQQ
jgi:hypothetical protein